MPTSTIGLPDFPMTYDRTPKSEIPIRSHDFHTVQVTMKMKNTHHARVPELVISPRPVLTP